MTLSCLLTQVRLHFFPGHCWKTSVSPHAGPLSHHSLDPHWPPRGSSGSGVRPKAHSGHATPFSLPDYYMYVICQRCPNSVPVSMLLSAPVWRMMGCLLSLALGTACCSLSLSAMFNILFHPIFRWHCSFLACVLHSRGAEFCVIWYISIFMATNGKWLILKSYNYC